MTHKQMEMLNQTFQYAQTHATSLYVCKHGSVIENIREKK